MAKNSIVHALTEGLIELATALLFVLGIAAGLLGYK